VSFQSANEEEQMIHHSVTNSLRFPKGDEIDCTAWGKGCTVAEGLPAFAIHLVNGEPLCEIHSPHANLYVPCSVCEELPAYAPERDEEETACQPCLRKMIEKAAEETFMKRAKPAPANTEPTVWKMLGDREEKELGRIFDEDTAAITKMMDESGEEPTDEEIDSWF
jgi:hypothetical protein